MACVNASYIFLFHRNRTQMFESSQTADRQPRDFSYTNHTAAAEHSNDWSVGPVSAGPAAPPPAHL